MGVSDVAQVEMAGGSGRMLLGILCGSGNGSDYPINHRQVDFFIEQKLVGCDTSDEDQGCEGGLMDDTFKFIQHNHGLASETTIPTREWMAPATRTRRLIMQLRSIVMKMFSLITRMH